MSHTVNQHRHNPEAEHEHEFEAAHGLPEALPVGERLLWQGAPDWKTLAREAMHVRLLAGYFGVLLVWRVVSAVADGSSVVQALSSAAWLLPLALLALGMLSLLAWLTSRSSVYTVTDRRVVMRIGIVLTITFNLPFRAIDAAGLRSNADGTGDIVLSLAGTHDRIAYVHLWPHVRPWRVKRTEPMLRAVPNASAVARLLAQAMAATVPSTVVAPLTAAVPARVHGASAQRPAVGERASSRGPALAA